MNLGTFVTDLNLDSNGTVTLKNYPLGAVVPNKIDKGTMSMLGGKELRIEKNFKDSPLTKRVLLHIIPRTGNTARVYFSPMATGSRDCHVEDAELEVDRNCLMIKKGEMTIAELTYRADVKEVELEFFDWVRPSQAKPRKFHPTRIKRVTDTIVITKAA